MSPWSLYIIRCRDGELYTGVTTDVNRRFVEHQGGGPRAAKYLKGKAPLQLVYQELVGSRSEALKREIQVKKLSRQQKLALLNASRATAG
jgi:putative endonuclease